MKSLPSVLALVGGSYVFGAERISLDVLGGLRKKGYELHVILNGWNDGKFPSALRMNGIPYDELKLGWYYLRKIWWSLDSLSHYPGAVAKFIRLKKKIKPGIIYVSSYRPVVLLWPFLKANIIYHVHDINSDNKQSRFLIKLTDRKIIHYIAVSELVKQDLVSMGIAGSKIQVIHNGTGWVDETAPKKTQNIISFGIVGQIIERKGHLQVLKAIRLLKDKKSRVRLKIVGTGDAAYQSMLKEFARSNGLEEDIEWCGNRSGIVEIYAGIDVLLAPTITAEPFGLIAIEANMLSIPVIASNSGGFKETIRDGFNGYLVDVMDASLIMDKMEVFCNSLEKIREMGHNGRMHVQQYFTVEAMNEKIDLLMRSLNDSARLIAG